MAWKGVVTNAGKELLNTIAEGGHTLTITRAAVGSGTTEEINLREATELANEKADASIVSAKTSTDGITTFKVQISPAEETAYICTEVGLFAKVDDESEVLFALHQTSDKGINIPTKAEYPSFVASVYAKHEITNDGDTVINIDETVYVSQSTIDEQSIGFYVQDGLVYQKYYTDE